MPHQIMRECLANGCNTSSTGEDLETFTIFTKLVPEVRDMVWAYVAHFPQNIAVEYINPTLKSGDENDGEDGGATTTEDGAESGDEGRGIAVNEEHEDNEMNLAFYKAANKTPAILHICRESRWKGLKAYVACPSNEKAGGYETVIYINPMVDTVRITFNGNAFPIGLAHSYSLSSADSIKDAQEGAENTDEVGTMGFFTFLKDEIDFFATSSFIMDETNETRAVVISLAADFGWLKHYQKKYNDVKNADLEDEELFTRTKHWVQEICHETLKSGNAWPDFAFGETVLSNRQIIKNLTQLQRIPVDAASVQSLEMRMFTLLVRQARRMNRISGAMQRCLEDDEVWSAARGRMMEVDGVSKDTVEGF